MQGSLETTERSLPGISDTSFGGHVMSRTRQMGAWARPEAPSLCIVESAEYSTPGSRLSASWRRPGPGEAWRPTDRSTYSTYLPLRTYLAAVVRTRVEVDRLRPVEFGQSATFPDGAPSVPKVSGGRATLTAAVKCARKFSAIKSPARRRRPGCLLLVGKGCLAYDDSRFD